MTISLLDTSVFVARETGRGIADLPSDDVAVSAVTVGELRWGVLAASDESVRSRRLDTLQSALAMDPIPVDDRVAAAWALFRQRLRGAGAKMNINDSWIAATAIAHGMVLVTQDGAYDHLEREFPVGFEELEVCRV